MAQRNDEHPLRSLVYLSDLKLNQILDSIDERTRWKIAAQLTIDLKLLSLTLTGTSPDRSLRNRGRAARLMLTEQYLRQRQQIGGPASGDTWIEGRAEMGWKPLQDGKTVLFCGYAGPLLLALGGSVSNVLGYPASEDQTGSYTATIREAVSEGGQPERFWYDLEAMAREVCVMPQPVRFIARVLSRHRTDAEPDSDSAGAGIVLATPLYVELDDQPPAGPPANVPHVAMPDPPMPSSQSESLASPMPEEPRTIGPYEVLRRLGEGAMGVVYQVRDEGGRDLALKVIRPEYAQDVGFLRRFAAEVDTARRVRATSIVGVIDAAVNAEMPYLVSEFTEGPTIEERVSSRDGPLLPGDAIQAGIGMAAALAAIHAAGFIHRDLTPSNVILSPDGPKVIDFGVARSAASGHGPRAERLRIGTPAYMSPEQVQHEELTSASDVFSWASVMVYATTGHQAFGRTSRVGVFWEIQEDEPDLTGVPDGLREIISAAFAKDFDARPSADELIQRLRTIDDPQPSPQASRMRRHRVGLLVAAAVLITAGAVAAVPELAGGARTAASASNRAYAPVVLAPATGSLMTGLKNPDRMPITPIFSPDGRSLAVGSAKGMAYVWDLATRKVTATLAVPRDPGIVSLAYAPSGRVIAATANDGIYLWGTAKHKPVADLNYSEDPAPASVAYAPSGLTLAEAAENVYLWNTATEQITAILPNPVSGSLIGDVAYFPSGRIIAGDEGFGTNTYLWNVATHKVIATFPAPASQHCVGRIAWSPNGKLLAIAGGCGFGDAVTYLWSIGTHKLIARLPDPKGLEVNDLSWVPGGQVLATSDQNGRVYLWDVATRKITATLADPKSQGALSVAFSPDGTVLAIGDSNGYTYLWRIRTLR